MTFLRWVSKWAEGIPFVGSYIANLVERIESGIDYAYGWVKSWVEWLKDSFYPWVRDYFDYLSRRLDNLFDHVHDYIGPKLDAVSRSLKTLNEWYNWVRKEVNSFVSDPKDYISRHIPDWIKEGINNAIKFAVSSWDWITTRGNEILKWIANANEWFAEQLYNARQRIITWVYESFKHVFEWYESASRVLEEFIKNPKEYIIKAVLPALNPIFAFINSYPQFVNQIHNAFYNAIAAIDEFILQKLRNYIASFTSYFLFLLLKDLFTLKYDIEKKEVIGKPVNPLTAYFIQEIEIEQPIYEYQTITDELEVEEYEKPI